MCCDDFFRVAVIVESLRQRGRETVKNSEDLIIHEGSKKPTAPVFTPGLFRCEPPVCATSKTITDD
jgi:hypothetical protein